MSGPDWIPRWRSITAIFLAVLMILSIPATVAVTAGTSASTTDAGGPGVGAGVTTGDHSHDRASAASPTVPVETTGQPSTTSPLETVATDDESDIGQSTTAGAYELQISSDKPLLYNSYGNTLLEIVDSSTGESVTGATLEAVEIAAYQAGERVDVFRDTADKDEDGEPDKFVVQTAVQGFDSEVRYEATMPDGSTIQTTRSVVPVSLDLSKTRIPADGPTEIDVTITDPRANTTGFQDAFSRNPALYLQPRNLDINVTDGQTTTQISDGSLAPIPLFDWANRTLNLTVTASYPEAGPGQIDVSTYVDPDVSTEPVEPDGEPASVAGSEHVLVEGTLDGYRRSEGSFSDPCRADVAADPGNESWTVAANCTTTVNTDEIGFVLTNEDTGETETVSGETVEIPAELLTNTTDNVTVEIVDFNVTTDADDAGGDDDDDDDDPSGSGRTTVGIPPFDTIEDEEGASCVANQPDRIKYNDTLEITVATQNIASVTVTHNEESGSGGTKAGRVTRWPEIDEPQTATFTIECVPTDPPGGGPITLESQTVHWAPFNIRAHLGTVGFDVDGLNFDRNWNLDIPNDTTGEFIVDDTVTLELGQRLETTPIGPDYATVDPVPNELAVQNSKARGIARNKFGDVIYQERNEPVENHVAPAWLNNFLEWTLFGLQLETDMAGGSSSLDLDETIEITFLEQQFEKKDGLDFGPLKAYDYDVSWNGSFGYKWPKNSLTASTSFSAEKTIVDLLTKGEVSAEVELNAFPFKLEKAKISGSLQGGKSYSFDASLPVVGGIEGEATVSVGPTVDFVVATNWNPQKFGVGVTGNAGVEGDASIVGKEVTLGGSGSVTGQANFDLDPFISFKNVQISVKLTASASTTTFFGKEVGVSSDLFDFSCTLPPGSCDSNGVIYEAPGDVTTLATAGGTAPAYDPADTWSTNRSYQDSQPSVTVTDNATVTAYTSQNASKSVDQGQDIVVARDGNRTRVTGAGLFDDAPAIASNGSFAAVAFRRAFTNDLENDTLAEIFNSTDIALVTSTGSGPWSATERVTNDTTEGIGEIDAAVTEAGNVFVASEVRSTFEGNATDVRWRVLAPNGTALSAGLVTDASSPEVDNGLGLAVVDRTTEQVRNGSVAGGSFTATGVYNATNYIEHALAGGDLVVLNSTTVGQTIYGNEREPQLRHITNGTEWTAPAAPISSGIESVEDMDATVTNGTLTAVTHARTDAGEAVWRQTRTPDGWSAPRNLTAPESVSLKYLDVAGDESLVAAFTAMGDANDSVEDVYVTNRSDSPAFTITDTESIRFGTVADINVSVENVGGSNGSVEVRLLENASEPGESVLDSRALSVDAGDIETATFSSTTVPDDGQLRATIDNATTVGEYTGVVDIDVATPRLQVTETRMNDSTGELDVYLSNVGLATAENLTVALEERDRELANSSVSRLPVGVTEVVTIDVPSAALNASAKQRIDVRGEVPDRALETFPHSVRLLQPELVIDPGDGDNVIYRNETDGTLTAFVDVRNYGETPFTGSLRATAVTNGTVDSENASAVSSSYAPGETATVAVPLGADIDRGDTVQFSLPNVTTATSELGTTVSTVDAPINAARFGFDSLNLSQSAIRPGQNVTVSVTLANDGDLGGIRNLTLTIGDTTVDGRLVELGPDGTAMVTFENVTLDREAGEYEVSVASRTDSISQTLDVELVSLEGLDIAEQGESALIASGQNHSVMFTVESRRDDAATFELGLEISPEGGEPVLSESKNVTLNGSETDSISFQNVTGTVDVAAENYTVEIQSAGSVLTGSLEVYPDVNGNGEPATDTTGDGLLNDVNGNGQFGIADVVVLFQQFNSGVVADNPSLFRFSEPAVENPERVGIADVVALFRAV
jgi:hypothetical protein